MKNIFVNIIERNNYFKAISSIFLSLLLVLNVCFLSCCFSNEAFADIRKTDNVCCESVEKLGLTFSQCPNIDAEYAFLLDSNGRVFFDRNADTQCQIASITKIMTAIIALDYGQLSDTLTVSKTAASIGESSAMLRSGDVITMQDALLALMVPSGNDAAQAICEYYGSKMLQEKNSNSLNTNSQSEANQAFVNAMNEKAASLGMNNTYFTNPHGLDDDEYSSDQHSTARDVATMCSYAMKNEYFRHAVSQEDASITVNRNGTDISIILKSTDELLSYVDGACGIKTGNTDLAGGCFAGAFNRDGVEIYSVILKSPSEIQRFEDTKTLIEWFYSHYITYRVAPPISNGDNIAAYVAHAAFVERKIPARFREDNASIKVFNLCGNVSQKLIPFEITGDVSAGDVVGQVQFLQHNKEIARLDLISVEDIAAPDFFETIGIVIDRFFKHVFGQSTVANSELVNSLSLINDKTSNI